MANCGTLLKIVPVALLLVAAVSGQGVEKLASCCKQVTDKEITEPILEYLLQDANPPCVKAVIFQTEKGLYCSYAKALWVRRKVMELMKANKAQSTVLSAITSSPGSLLSIITSTAYLPSSSTASLPSSSSSPPSTSSN